MRLVEVHQTQAEEVTLQAGLVCYLAVEECRHWQVRRVVGCPGEGMRRQEERPRVRQGVVHRMVIARLVVSVDALVPYHHSLHKVENIQHSVPALRVSGEHHSSGPP